MIFLNSRLLSTVFLGIVLSAMGGVSAPAWAEENCDCSSYVLHESVVPLARQVGIIGLIALTEDHPTFYPTQQHRDALEVISWDRKNIPKHCRKKLPPVTLRMRYSTSSGNSGLLPSGADGNYFSVMMQSLNIARELVTLTCPGQPNPTPPPGPGLPPLTASDASGGPQSDQTTGPGTLDPGNSPPGGGMIITGAIFVPPVPPPWCVSTSPATNTAALLAEATRGEIGEYLSGGLLTKEDFKLLDIFYHVAHSGSEANAEKYVREASKNLTLDQKLLIGQIAGFRSTAVEYNQKRFGDRLSAEGVVSFDEYLNAWSSNIDNGYNVLPPDQERPADWAYAGLCRDAAVVQAKLFTWMDLKAYTRSYVNRGGAHTNVVVYDPKKPGQLYKINWSDRTDVRNLEGGQAMYEGVNDEAIVYRYADANGKSIAQAPSEFGKVMTELAGFSPRTIDPLVSSRSTVLSADLSRNPKHDYRLFYAQDPTGASYMGGAYNRPYRSGTNTPGQVGFVVGSQSKPAHLGGIPITHSLDFVYAQLEQHLKSRKIDLADKKLQGQIDSVASAMLLLGFSRIGLDYDGARTGKSALTVDGSVNLQTGVTLKQGSAIEGRSSRLGAVYGAYVQAAPGLKDIRNNNGGDVPGNLRLFLSHALFTAEGRLRLSKSEEGRAYLLAATHVLVDNIGVRGKGELGVAVDDLAVTLSVQGHLTKDTPALKEGTLRRAGGKVRYRVNPSVQADLSWYYNLEDDAELGKDFGVMGNISIQR